jgi:hypothetical protein
MTTSHDSERMKTPAVPSAPFPPVRASDAEREATVARLHRALGEGRLDLAEIDERAAAAYAAQYRNELPPLLADLPDEPSSGAPAWSGLWVATVWAARDALLGNAGTDSTRPTAAHCRTAAWMVALAIVWIVGCAVLGAAMVGP